MSRTKGFGTKIVLIIFIISIISIQFVDVNAAKTEEEERIAAINRMIEEKGYNWKAGKTSMSHITEEEWKELFPPLPVEPVEITRTLPVIKAPAGATYPAVWDWREMNGVTPAKNQYEPQHCGSCWSFSSVGQLESHIRIFDGRIEDLSEQQILSCNTGGGDCDGGNPWMAYEIFADPGAVTETCMPYQAQDTVSCDHYGCGIRGRISGTAVVGNEDINSMKEALLTGPVTVSLWATTGFLYYTEGCWTTDDLGYAANHSVLCVGWDDTQCDGEGAWIIKNSFGEDWGMNGFGYVKFGTPDFNENDYGNPTARQIFYVEDSGSNLHVKKPDGKEAWAIGSAHMIEWHSYDSADHFEIGYFIGEEYTLIDEDVDGNAREYDWTIPNDISTECKVRVTALDEYDVELTSDSSDESFAILEPAVDWEIQGQTVCSAGGNQNQNQIISDEDGNAIVAWMDFRTTANYYDIYAQKIDDEGNVLWTNNGIGVCTAIQAQSGVRLVSDGGGGAIITWVDKRNGNYDIYAQKMDTDGDPMWVANGIGVCTNSSSQTKSQVVSDGSGGAIIVWQDARNGLPDIFAQRVGANGNLLWAAGGIPVCDADDEQVNPKIVTDGSGGAIVVWQDSRGAYNLLYAQRVDGDGNPLWTAGGIPVCDENGSRQSLNMIADNWGGAIFGWEDYQNGINEIFVQKIASNGSTLWGSSGVAVYSGVLNNCLPVLTTDGADGAIIGWCDENTECDPRAPFGACERSNIFCQRVDADGYPLWTSGGMPLCTAKEDQDGLQITYDGMGGALFVWKDFREGTNDIYLQRLNSFGETELYENGEPICSCSGEKLYISTGNDHGANVYVSWTDARNGAQDVFAQKITGDYSTLPGCDITWEIVNAGTGIPTGGDSLNGCPAGDYHALRVDLDFDSGPIDASQITLGSDSLLIFWGSNTADSSATADNGYRTTLTRSYVSAGGPVTDICPAFDIPVLFDGVEIGRIGNLRLKSYDYTMDGYVNLSDLAYFGDTNNKTRGDAGYNDWFDYNYDETVNSPDLNLLFQHYQHHKPLSSSRMLAGSTHESKVDVRFTLLPDRDTGNPDKVRVKVSLSGANDISMMALGISNRHPSLKYRGWTPAAGLPVTTEVVQIGNDETDKLCMISFALGSAENGDAELGILEFSCSGDADVKIEDDDLRLLFGEVLDMEGNILRIQGIDFEEETPEFSDFLANNYPNPFNPSTIIRFSIAGDSHVNLSIFDVNGRLVRTLVDEFRKSNSYSVTWDGKNEHDKTVSSGVYFYRIKTDKYSKSRKLILLR